MSKTKDLNLFIIVPKTFHKNSIFADGDSIVKTVILGLFIKLIAYITLLAFGGGEKFV